MPAVSDLDACPECGTSWLAEPIPEASRHHYGGRTHFRRLIGIYDPRRDRTVAWRCPDCGTEWDRNAKAEQ